LKKVAIVAGLAVVAVALVLSWPQLGTGQLFGGARKASDSEELQQEIAMLKLVNELELSVEQMTALKDQIQLIRTGHDAVNLADVELRDFLVSFKGTREEHREAIKPFNDKVAQAQEAFHQQLQTSVEAVKDLLSLRQGEILQDHFMMRHAMMGMRMMEMPEHSQHPGEFNAHINSSRQFKKDIAKKIEQKFESFGAKMEAWSEQLGDSIEDWFDGWDMDSDMDSDGGHHIRIFRSGDGSEEWEVYPAQQIQMLMRAPGKMIMHDLFSELLMEHLELLDQVLTDKLINLAPTPAPIDQSSV